MPSGILFDMHREAAAKRPGVLTKVGLDTFVDPRHQGCAMNDAAQRADRRADRQFDGEEWLYFPAIAPDVSIIRATTADERGNLTYEHEGAYLGGLEQALAARNNGGIVIAQVKRVVENGSLKPHDVRVPGMLVDYIVVAPDQLQTTQTPYDPAISGEIFRPLYTFRVPEFNIQKVIARRVAMELAATAWAVNIGFGISANVPRILLEEGQHGKVTWVIEQGAVGGVPLLDFKFGCASNADAFMPSPHQFIYFQAGGFDASLLSFLQIDRQRLGQRLEALGAAACDGRRRRLRRHHRAGEEDRLLRLLQCRRQAFASPMARLRIDQEGKVKKVVEEVEHISFSGKRAVAQGQDITYVTERCVMKLTPEGLRGHRDRAGRRPSSATSWRRRSSRLTWPTDLKTMPDRALPRSADRPAAAQWRRRMADASRSPSSRTARSARSRCAGRKSSTRSTSRCCGRWKRHSTRPRPRMACASC